MIKATWLHSYVLDPLERAGSTFVQQFVVILMVGSSATLLVTQNWLLAADTAGFAALISLLTSIATFAVPKLPTWADLLLRVLKTGVQSFLGSLTASVVAPSIVHAPWLGALAIAVPVMLTALLKGLASLAAPWSDGASLLPIHPALYSHNVYEPANYDENWGPLDSASASTPEPSKGPAIGTPVAPRLGTPPSA